MHLILSWKSKKGFQEKLKERQAGGEYRILDFKKVARPL